MKKPKPYYIVCCLVFLNACNTGPGKPGLQIIQPSLALNNIKFDSTYNIEYKLANNGSADLYIDTVTASCGCSVPTIDRKQVRPGDTAILMVSFKPPDTGSFSKKIVIKSNIDSVFSLVSFSGIAEK